VLKEVGLVVLAQARLLKQLQNSENEPSIRPPRYDRTHLFLEKENFLQKLFS
jgi:hypothetical protein